MKPPRVVWAVFPGIVLMAAACSPETEQSSGGAVPSGAAPPAFSGGSPEPHPADGEGTVTLTPATPVPAGAWGSWTVGWIAGPSGLRTGGGVVLQVSPFWGWSPPQASRPGAPGYTTVACSDPDVSLALGETGVPMSLVASVESGRLSPGDTLRFVYGDTTAGGPASLARADRYAEDFEELLIKTDGNGDGLFVAPPDQPTLRILPGPAQRIALSAPALTAPGDSFDVALHALDGIGNRAEFPPGRWKLSARPLATEQAAAADAVVLSEGRHGGDPESDPEAPASGVRPRVRLDRAGLYRLEAEWTGDGRRLGGRNDLLLVESGSPFRDILWGDIHCHSALSDGTGSPEDLYAFGRDVAGLDVCSVTDHDAHGLFPLAERGGWDRVRRATHDAYEPGRYVTLLGYEWTNWTYGHRNVYYPGDEGEVFSFHEPENNDPYRLWDHIAPFGGMTIAHHPGGGPVPVDWSVPTRAERETVVEICSIHGSSETVGAERGIYRPVPSGMVRAALARGHELGILASGDTHDGHPGHRSIGAPANGLAAFRCGERTREAVWDALRTRRVYGTSGPRILLATDWDGERPGVRLDRRPGGALRVRVCAPEPVEVVEVIGPAGTLAASYGGGRRVEKRFFADGTAPHAGWLFVRVVLADGEMAWESPFWLPEEDS